MGSVTRRRPAIRRAEARRRGASGARVGAAQPMSLFNAPTSEPMAAMAATAERSAAPADTAVVCGGEPAAPVSGSGETLDRQLVAGWELLLRRNETACVLCGGTMEPRYGAHALPIGGRCRDCGTTLS